MAEFYELTIVRHRNGKEPLTESITCDAEMAATWCRAVADELHPYPSDPWAATMRRIMQQQSPPDADG